MPQKRDWVRSWISILLNLCNTSCQDCLFCNSQRKVQMQWFREKQINKNSGSSNEEKHICDPQATTEALSHAWPVFISNP